MTPVLTNQPVIGIKGAGEMASAVAWRLFSAHIYKIFMMEIDTPQAVRRGVSFCEAVYEEKKEVEDVKAIKVRSSEEIQNAWLDHDIPVIIDPTWKMVEKIKPDVVVDAILSKSNLGTNLSAAPLVIGLGPGFTAGQDVHIAIETNRGHNLGRIITTGSVVPNTGIPGNIGGQTIKRVVRAPVNGLFKSNHAIGDFVKCGDIIGSIEGLKIQAEIDGILRGLIRPETSVTVGLKLGDIDPRGESEYCYTISDKARAIAGSVLEAILRIHNSAISL